MRSNSDGQNDFVQKNSDKYADLFRAVDSTQADAGEKTKDVALSLVSLLSDPNATHTQKVDMLSQLVKKDQAGGVDLTGFKEEIDKDGKVTLVVELRNPGDKDPNGRIEVSSNTPDRIKQTVRSDTCNLAPVDEGLLQRFAKAGMEFVGLGSLFGGNSKGAVDCERAQQLDQGLAELKNRKPAPTPAPLRDSNDSIPIA